MSSWTTTVPNSVRNSAPVGQTSRQPALVQCLQTLEAISQRNSERSSAPTEAPGGANDGMPSSTGGAEDSALGMVIPVSCPPSGLRCSMNSTCRQVLAPSAPELSYELPRSS